MKLIKYSTIFFFIGILTFACEEEEYGQTVVSFVDERTGTVVEGSTTSVTATLMLSQVTEEAGTVTINLPDDMIETIPASNGRNLTLTFPEGETFVTFQLKYNDDQIINERQRMLPISISSTGGAIESVGNEIFYLEVIDNDVSTLEQNFDELCENEVSLESLGWTVYNVSSEYNWRCTTPNRGSTGEVGDYGFEMNNFGSPDGEAGDDWLITPKLNFSDTASLSFTSVKRYAGSTIEVLISSDYEQGEDPSGYSWTEITEASNAFASNIDSWDYVSSGRLDISNYTGSNYIAFHVTSPGTTSGQSSTVRVDNIRVGGVTFTAIPGDGGNGGGGGGDNENVFAFPFSDDFESCSTEGQFNIPSNWTEAVVSGNKTDRGWGCREEGVTGWAVRASGFGGTTGTENAWLITANPIDMSSASNVFINAMIISQHEGLGNLSLKWSEDYSGTGDPTTATWNTIDIASQLPDMASGEYVQVSINVSSLVGKTAYIAFQYEGATADDASSWTIDDFQVTDTGSDTGGGSNPTAFSLPFTDEFESCSSEGQFNIPSNWIEKMTPTSKTDRGWGCREEGVTGWAVRASSFGGSDGTDDAWMISKNPFDLTAVSSATLTFMVKSQYDGLGDLKVLYSSNYNGQSDPTQATWTELTNVQAQLPAKASNSYVEITSDLSGAVGKNIYLAFQWVNGTSDDSASYTIDDLSVE